MIKILRGDIKDSSIELPEGFDTNISNCGKISLTRDFFSSIPLFYFVDKNELIISDSYLELTGFLRTKEVALFPDSEYIKLYITFQTPNTSRTLLKKIKRLRPGERIFFDEQGNLKSEFVERISNAHHRYTSNNLRSHIDAIVEKLNPSDTTFHISSGLDSSILAIRAARVFPERSIHLATCLTRGDGCSNELDNSKRLAEDIGADLVIYDLTNVDIFKEGESLLKNCLGFPVAHPSHLVEYLLNQRIVGSGASTIVNGKGPDDCLAGYSWHLDKFQKAMVHKNRLTVTADADLIELTGSSIDLVAEDDIWKEIENPLSLNKRLEYDARSVTDAWNIIHSSIAKRLEVQIVSPFMDPVIRSGLFSLPDSQKINGLRQKYFLRETFKNDYPDYILDFSKHGFRLDLQPYFLDYDSEELFLKITCNLPWVDRYFNLNKIKMMIDSTIHGKKNYGWQLWSIFCVVNAINS